MKGAEPEEREAFARDLDVYKEMKESSLEKQQLLSEMIKKYGHQDKSVVDLLLKSAKDAKKDSNLTSEDLSRDYDVYRANLERLLSDEADIDDDQQIKLLENLLAKANKDDDYFQQAVHVLQKMNRNRLHDLETISRINKKAKNKYKAAVSVIKDFKQNLAKKTSKSNVRGLEKDELLRVVHSFPDLEVNFDEVEDNNDLIPPDVNNEQPPQVSATDNTEEIKDTSVVVDNNTQPSSSVNEDVNTNNGPESDNNKSSDD